MAGHDDRYGISIVGHADSAEGVRLADSARDVGVSARLAVWNSQQRVPACNLKAGSPQIQGKSKIPPPAGKVFFEFAKIRFQQLGRAFEVKGLALDPQVARIGPNGLLPGQALVELQRDQPLG